MCETPSAFRQIERKARKNHKCCECLITINPKDVYVYTSGVWNGEPESYKQCINCASISEKASIYDYDHNGDGVGFGELSEWFFSYMCINFKGQEFISGMSEMVGVDPDDLQKCLKVDVSDSE